jgi:hypothetical protein
VPPAEIPGRDGAEPHVGDLRGLGGQAALPTPVNRSASAIRLISPTTGAAMPGGDRAIGALSPPWAIATTVRAGPAARFSTSTHLPLELGQGQCRQAMAPSM